MKKISKIFVLVLMVLFIKIDYVGAVRSKINATSNPTPPTKAQCVFGSSSEYCMYNNSNHATIRLSFVYYKDGVISKIGHSVYYSNARYPIKSVGVNSFHKKYNYFNESTTLNNKNHTSIIAYGQKWFAAADNNIDTNKIKKYFIDSDGNIRQNVIDTIEEVYEGEGPVPEKFSSKKKFSEYLQEVKLDGDKIKYRFIIEPVVSFATRDGNFHYYTAAGFAMADKKLTNSNRICEIADMLYAPKSDIGLTHGQYYTYDKNSIHKTCAKSVQSSARSALKRHTQIAQGMGIIDFTEKIKPPKPACDYKKDKYFKDNIKGKVAPTSKKGSGPNGENCCNIDDEKVWNAYKKQWKKEHPKDKETISKKAFKLYLLNTLRRTYCFQTITPPPKEDPATCTLNNVSNYSDKTDDFDMTVSSILDRGTSSVTSRQPENSRYRRETITHRGWINCGEEIKLTLPIQYQQEVYRGLKMEWPTYDNEKRSNNYPLELNGKATCNLEIDYEGVKYDNAIWGTCCGWYSCWSCIVGYNWSGIRSDINYIKNRAMDWKKNTSNHYDVNGNFFVKYNDKKYGGIFPIDRYSNGQKSYKYTGFSFGDTGGHFTIEQHSKYKINKNVYRYVLKLTSQMNESVSYRPAGQNYIDVGYGNLPISEDAASGKYNTIIQYNNLGGFSKKFQTSTASYICPYEIGDKIECSCDPGTVNAGMDLIQCMNGACDGKQYTCAEAKEKFCDDNSIKEKYVCPENTRNAGKDITAYVKQYGYDEAVKRYCHDPNKFTVCPNGTTYEGMSITKECYNSENCRRFTCNIYTCPSKSDHPGMVINTAISDRMKIKKCAFQTAYKEIVNTVCYEGADRIIYRVIDLRDPFPGKKGFGRTPGMNWRNENLVKKYITNNRGVANNKVYNKSKAMYHFKLTPSTIKSIRSYNSKNKYSDFKLTCKKKNGRECISDFVHNTSYGLKGGSCYNSGSFNRCR